MAIVPPHKSPYRKRHWRLHHLLFHLLLILFMTGVTLWVLNIIAVIPGLWLSVLGAIFTALSVLFAFLEWYKSSFHQGQDEMSDTAIDKRLDDAHLGITKRRGALLIWTKKDLSGLAVHLFRGFNRGHEQYIDAASTVIEVQNGRRRSSFVAIFPALEPGKYTVALPGLHYATNITVPPQRITRNRL